MRVVQEFYCHHCDGYFRASLNMALNLEVMLKCPNCGEKHDRCIKDGKILERQSRNGNPVNELIVMPSTYSKTAVLGRSKRNMRDGCVVQDPSRDFVNDRWKELYGDRV